jgi:DNA-binding winged helix-turn-helix (wHTH) protein/tetratricopeptide (TPR) repeat protein
MSAGDEEIRMDPSTEIRFDGWTLRRPSGELLREGSRIRLQTQPLLVLEELLARPGELVTREQLITRLWPKGVVDFDTALNSAVRRLRMALGDHAESPRYIETIPRRGYRFIGRLDASPVAPPETHAPSFGYVQAAAGVPVQPSARRAPWRPAALSLLLVTVVATALSSSRPVEPRSGMSAAGESATAQAGERYQRAQFLFQRRAPGDIALARQYYRGAIEAEPGFARAWAGLAGTYWLDTIEGRTPTDEGLPLMRDAAEKALELDPGLAVAHLRLATYFGQVGDLPRHAEHLRRALELDPDDPLVLGTLASEDLNEGRLDEAIALQRRAVEADPLSGVTRYNLASMLYFAGRLDEAEAELRKVRELNPLPDYVNEVLGRVLVLEGRFDEAVELAEPWPDGTKKQMVLAMAWHGLGRAAESDAALRALSESPEAMDRLRIAEVHAFRGEIEEAFRWLSGPADVAPGGLQAVSPSALSWMIPLSPFLRPLHSDPRWAAWRKARGPERNLRVVASAR